MKREEIYKELQMPYDELQQYLRDKYGGALYDYFLTPECKTKNRKVGRSGEGLFCHHMDEDKGGDLGNPAKAREQPFEWQKKERLVYCNIIEHLILHMKIAVLRQKVFLRKPDEVVHFFTTGGIFKICSVINDMFSKNGTSVAWRKRCFEEVKENYQDYIILIKSLLTYIDNCYVGEKNRRAFLVQGAKVHFADCDGEIVRISDKRDVILLKLPTGEEKRFSIAVAMNQLEYVDQVDCVTRIMSFGYGEPGFYKKIYDDIVSCDNVAEVTNCAEALKVDYRGHGYAQYASIELEKKFGSKNADEYISKALPMFCQTDMNFSGKTPKFWKGKDIPPEAANLFYIVRFETMFTIKEGEEPFVRYREPDLLRGYFTTRMSNNHNLKDYGWTVLSTSDVYDKKTNRYYSQYVDFSGKIVDAKVILSLGSDDYLLFKKRYDIRYLKILDGCYFL